MRIDNTYLTNRTLGQPEPAVPASTGPSALSGPHLEVSAHVPSAELVDLLQRVRQAPSVRQDVLAQVAQRLQSGYYQTRAAAEQTAGALQQAQE